MSIPAKPTRYGRYTFRSQLEARWAFFFDALGIRYLYEPRLYQLRNDLFYKPDFWLIDHYCFIEVKGERPQQREKMRILALTRRVNVYTCFGDVAVPDTHKDRGILVDYGNDYYFSQQTPSGLLRIRYPVRSGQLPIPSSNLFNAYGRWGLDYGWSECEQCKMITIASSNPGIRWQCACPEPLIAPHSMTSPRLCSVYHAANAHHFLQKTASLEKNLKVS